VTTLLLGIPKNDFQDCFWQWHHHLTKCIASQGDYFEVTAAASSQVSKFCFHRAIPGIRLSHRIQICCSEANHTLDSSLSLCIGMGQLMIKPHFYPTISTSLLYMSIPSLLCIIYFPFAWSVHLIHHLFFFNFHVN
jgi:hypothetical protein